MFAKDLPLSGLTLGFLTETGLLCYDRSGSTPAGGMTVVKETMLSVGSSVLGTVLLYG
jgi:hypothetical protein